MDVHTEGGTLMSGQGRQEVRVEGAHEPISHYTHAVISGNLVFVSGCVAADGHGELIGGDDPAAQTRQVLENLAAILSAAGTSLASVLKMTVYLTDIDDRPKINPVRQEFFGDVRPASTLIEVSRLALPGAKVEIDVVACIP
jgi:reactive intermediate/imine deaminase